MVIFLDGIVTGKLKPVGSVSITGRTFKEYEPWEG